MNVEYLIQILENRLNFLAQAKDQAQITGDLERVNAVDIEILSVQDTLCKLRLLLDASQTAANVNASFSEVVTAGVEAVQNSPIIQDNAIMGLEEYDISTYASDPLYEQKIADILGEMGIMDTADQIDSYINNEAISSPVTGAMILEAAQKYSADPRLMMAIMELDSRFGTAGVGVYTLNPGNVGNTGVDTRTYDSWEEGVAAVAEWLSRHRKITASEPAPSPIPAPLETPVPSEAPASTSATNETPTQDINSGNGTSTSTPLSVNLKAKGRKRFFRDKA